MSWFTANRPPQQATNPGQAMAVANDGGMTPSDPWEQQMLSTLEQRYGKGNPLVAQEFNYYKQKRASDETSGRVGTGEFPNMDAYWLHRATGTDPQDAPGAGGNGLPPGYSTNAINSVAPFSATGLNAPFTQEASYDPEEILNSKEFQTIMGRGMDAIGKSTAAKGTLQTGGTLKEMGDFLTGSMSQHIGDVLGRKMGVLGFNRDTFWGNQKNAFGNLYNTAELGARSAGSYGDNLANIMTNQGNVNAANTMNKGSIFGDAVSGATNLGSAWLLNRNRS